MPPWRSTTTATPSETTGLARSCDPRKVVAQRPSPNRGPDRSSENRVWSPSRPVVPQSSARTKPGARLTSPATNTDRRVLEGLFVMASPSQRGGGGVRDDVEVIEPAVLRAGVGGRDHVAVGAGIHRDAGDRLRRAERIGANQRRAGRPVVAVQEEQLSGGRADGQHAVAVQRRRFDG